MSKKKVQLFQEEVDNYRPIFKNNSCQIPGKSEKELLYTYVEELLATQTALPWKVQLKIVRLVCNNKEIKSLIDLEVDADNLLFEQIARDEMRKLDLSFDFKKFVVIGRKVAFYQTFGEFTLSETEAYKQNKKKMPVALFIQQPQQSTVWGGSSLYESTIQPQNIYQPKWS